MHKSRAPAPGLWASVPAGPTSTACGCSGHVWECRWLSCPLPLLSFPDSQGLCSLGRDFGSPCDTALGTGQVVKFVVTRRVGCCYGDGNGGLLPSARFLHGSSNDRPASPAEAGGREHRDLAPGCHGSTGLLMSPEAPRVPLRTPGPGQSRKCWVVTEPREAGWGVRETQSPAA